MPFRTNLRVPKVNEDLCIGCGACEYACPVRPERAITVAARAEHAFAREPYEPPATPPTPGDFAF
ncbi:2-oxoglutarate-acceptor oxidoreductase subunit OorD [compost metagenome]